MLRKKAGFALTLQEGSRIREVISALQEFEGELDAIRNGAEELKRELISFARSEAEKMKETSIAGAAERTESELEKIRRDAEEEARKIVGQSEKGVKALKGRIDKAFDDAVQRVLQSLLGA